MPRLHGEIRAVIARVPVTLICDINALCLIEEALEGDLGEIMRRFDQGLLTLTEERAFLHAFLAARQPGHTLAMAGDLMTADLEACRAQISAAIQAALPEVSPGKKPKARGLAAGLRYRIFSCPGWLRALILRISGG